MMLQMVKAGFGNAVLPFGLAVAMNLPASSFEILREARRTLRVHTRRAMAPLAGVLALVAQLEVAAAEWLATRSS
jgi:hypothetical protein